MNAIVQTPEIKARENIDFGLDQEIPKYWFRNDPFKTRIFDGLQITFPDGERYFISSVRKFRDKITDAKLKQDVVQFTRQEAQHGIAHTKYNQLLESQGVPMKALLEDHKKMLESFNQRFSPEFNVALTAAFEHFTALMANAFFGKKEVLEGTDERMKSLFAWHAIEEMEHRSVAFDVMQKVAKVGYFKRSGAMALGTYFTMATMFKMVDKLLEADGYSKRERRILFLKNLKWMYGKKGVLSAFTPELLAYFKPNFHPENIPIMQNYSTWVDVYEDTQDPFKACVALMEMAK